MSTVERGPIHFPWPPVLYVAAIAAGMVPLLGWAYDRFDVSADVPA